MLDISTSVKLGDGIFHTRVVNGNDYDGTLTINIPSVDFSKAVLAVFPRDEKWQINAKNAEVPIDVVWLSSDKKVVHIVRNIQPGNFGAVSAYPARYVVEFSAGTVNAKMINLNSIAFFEIDESALK